MKVSLFITCLVDQICPQVGLSTVELLERAGCEVLFDERQTCCGQPAFNSGYLSEARSFASRWIEIFESADSDAIVAPSGSCVGMVRHFAELFEDDADLAARAERLAEKTYELSDFLFRILKTEKTGGRFEGRIAWHDSCHALRELGISEAPRKLIAAVDGAELVELGGSDECCGFGGTFSVKYPEISAAIADKKIENIERSGADFVAACDASCLMQIGGRLANRGSKVRPLHVAEILAAGLSDKDA